MDVTEEYLHKLNLYGGSELSCAGELAASNSMVYAKGPTMQRAVQQKCTTVPFEFQYRGEIGLFGAENIFFKIDLDIQDTGPFCFEEPWYECAYVDINAPEIDVDWTSAQILWDTPELDPDYEGARMSNDLPYARANDFIKIELENQGTGNQYIDKTIHARFYSDCRFEHGFDEMYVPLKGSFYVGIHTTDTRRNAYAVNCKIGTLFKEGEILTADDKKLLPFCP